MASNLYFSCAFVIVKAGRNVSKYYDYARDELIHANSSTEEYIAFALDMRRLLHILIVFNVAKVSGHNVNLHSYAPSMQRRPTAMYQRQSFEYPSNAMIAKLSSNCHFPNIPRQVTAHFPISAEHSGFLNSLMERQNSYALIIPSKTNAHFHNGFSIYYGYIWKYFKATFTFHIWPVHVVFRQQKTIAQYAYILLEWYFPSSLAADWPLPHDIHFNHERVALALKIDSGTPCNLRVSVGTAWNKYITTCAYLYGAESLYRNNLSRGMIRDCYMSS